MSEHIQGPVKALILLRIDTRIEKPLLEELKQYKGVQEAHMIYGPYDIYVLAQCQTYDEMNDLVMNKVRRLYGVKSTTTCYIAE